MLTNSPYEYVLLFMHVNVQYVMLYILYAEKPNKFNIPEIFAVTLTTGPTQSLNSDIYLILAVCFWFECLFTFSAWSN